MTPPTPVSALEVERLVADLSGLYVQATQERSHFYVGKVCKEAATTLRALVRELEQAWLRHSQNDLTDELSAYQVKCRQLEEAFADRVRVIEMQGADKEALRTQLAQAKGLLKECSEVLRDGLETTGAYEPGWSRMDRELADRIDAALGATP